MQDIEKLGQFYLGRLRDVSAGKATDQPLLYDSKDLVTHAVCVGMTGSGKTGLCISLLEEAAIDGIPALVIDPKGDLGNLLLAFPELRPEDFAPWINEEDAWREGIEAPEYAARQAALWKSGLAKTGQDSVRIGRMLKAADFAIYTPASDAGLPLSILKSFDAPTAKLLEDRELLRERVSATATAVLTLAGIDADPIQSREHILVANVLDAAWKAGRSLDLGGLIREIQSPPFHRVGVLDLDSFYPAAERFQLASQINNLLASPGFDAWMEGEPLDIGGLLYTREGKPRIAIVSIAHLNDTERMFVVSLLLNQALAWMRMQSGTTSLRAILYMDEIFGYFPPVANPPSKLALLTLLKQARAFGLGVVLSTQNPVDLDYKGLANAGTWFIGRLQTERDKMRVLEGLEGASVSAAANFDRGRMEALLSSLGNRVFLMNNVHEDAPVLFETRWALSYLRGPLTRNQIKTLMDARRAHTADQAARPAPAANKATAAGRPILPPQVPQRFLTADPRGGPVVYEPRILGSAQVHFIDTKTGMNEVRAVNVLAPVRDDSVPVEWEESSPVTIEPDDLELEPLEPARFAPLPATAANPRSYAAWTKTFAAWLYATQTMELYRCPSLKLVSNPGESAGAFRVRVDLAAREERDRELEKLRQRYAPKLTALEDRLRRARQAVDREREQAQGQTVDTALAIGSGLLGALFGRKVLSTSTVGKATGAARSWNRSRRETQDVARASETLEAVEQQIADLEARLGADTDAVAAKFQSMVETIETLPVRAKKTDISVRLVALAWAPAPPDA